MKRDSDFADVKQKVNPKGNKRARIDNNINENNDNKQEINHEIKQEIIYNKYGYKKDFYKNKLILAPMVRVGTYPMRLLAKEVEFL